MPKPSREPRGRKNEWESLPESKSEVESYLSSRKETPKQTEQKYVWSYLPESLQEIEDRRQKQYQDLQAQRANIIPTATGNMDAEYAGYNKALAEYGSYWGDKAAHDEGFAGYNAAMDRVRGQYDSHEARHAESDRKVEERNARTSGMQGAGNRMADADRRSIRDKALYNRMAKDANTAGDYALYQRSAQGYNKTVSDYATNYSQAQSDYWDAAKTEQPGYYYEKTMSADEVDKRLEELRATKEKVHENLMRVLSDIDNNPHTQEERLQLSDTKYRIQDRYTKINNEIDYLETAKGLHKQRRGNEMYNYWLNEGGLEQSENYAKVEQGKAKYEADRLAASGGMKEPEIATPAGGAIKAYRDRNQKENEWDSIFDNAPNLTPSDEMVFYALYADDPEQAMEWAYYINNRRNSEFQGEIAAWGKEHPIPAWFGGLGNRMISGVANIVDPNSAFAQKQSLQSTGLLSGGAQALNEWSGTIDTDIPIIKDLFNGKGAGDFYQLASSIVESGINMAVASYTGDAAKLVGALGTFIMGSSAAAADYNESLQRGLTTAQAQRHALAAGINEAAFEFISLDKVIKADKLAGQLKKVFVDAGIEASEEFCTTVANRVADGYLARADGYDTQIEQRTKELIALGLSRAEAEEQAEREWRVELINDAIGGFISGGFHAGIEWVGGKVANKIATNQYNETAGIWTDAEEIAALQSFADANGIEYNAEAIRRTVEARDARETDSSPSAQNDGARETDSFAAPQNDSGDNTETKQSRREIRQERKSNREMGALKKQIVSKITETVHERGLNSAQEIYTDLTRQHGDGIAPSVYEAVTTEAFKNAAALKSADAIRAARDQAVKEIQDPAMKRAVSDGYDQAVFAQAMQSGSADEAGRYFQQLRNTGEGGMTMTATVKAQDGQEKQIAITGMTEDGKSVVLADGVKIAVKDLQADADTMDAVQRISELELGKDADAVLQAYIKADRKGVDGYRWLMDYTLSYEQGRTGKLSLEEAVNRSSLDARTVMEAYTLGQQEAHQSTKDAVEALKAMPKKQGITGKTSNFDTSEIEGVTLNESEREQFELANKVFSLIGVDVKWVSSKNKGNRFVGANGSYLNGVVTLDVHAGRNYLEQINSGILATTGHELTHFLQQYAPEQYRALKEFLFRQIVKGSANGETRLERLIWEKQRRSGTKLSRKAAEDEVVADACQTMLRDSKAIREFAQQNEEAAKGIVRWLDKWLNKLKQAFGRSAQLTEEARFVDSFAQEVREAFGKLWDEALREAVRVHDEIGNIEGVAIENKAQNQDIRYSQREQYEEAVEASDVLTRYSLREEPAPQKTIKAYKAFYVKDGKLYPPMVSNNTNEEDKQTVKKASSGTMKGLETPVGVWLDADVGGIAVDENGVPLRTKTTGRLQVQNDKGGGTLAFRPGWHLGEWPDASQFNVKDPVTGALKSVMPDNLVFAECEIAADVDYQLEAYEYGISDKGGFSRTQAGLPRVPTNGYYKYRTNVDPTTAPWYITGAMKVTKILSDEERRQICNQFGVTPQERASHKDIDLEAYGLKAGPVKQTENLERFRKNKASYDNDALLKAALEDENYSNAYVRRTLDFDNETLAKEFELDRISPDQVKKYRESYQSPEVMRSERESAAKANVSLDFQSESAAPSDGTLFSERTWTASRFVQDKANAANALAKALGVSERTAKKYINNINSVAKLISDDRVRLDYESAPGLSSFKSNAEYGGSIDFSTLCKKRRLMTGTFSAIQNALPNTVLTEDDVLLIRKMMKDAGLEVSCGLCYVEGSRTKMGEHNAVFLERYKQYYPKSWQPTMADVTTPDGIEKMRINHPEAYEKFEYFYNHYGKLKPSDKAIFASQQKPKMYQLRTEYNGEILQEFKTDQGVETKNRNGGLRLQSFSDFEIVHLIDCMQVIADMSEVGLAGQAYTKVPEFAEALGKTGLKINLSLITKSLDADGKLVFDDVEGMPHERAFDIRKKYSKNVGTILVVYDDAQLLAAMADPRIDFIIPFHISQWKKSQFEAMGLPPTATDYNYQLQQNEKWLDPEAHAKKATNYMPNEYWDFSLSGKQNAEKYLEMCAKDGKRPKFYKLLQNNGDGSFSLKADGSTDGYWKLLIDFKMYDNKGRGVPQQPVRPVFDMKNVNRMLEEYQGGHAKFPVAQGIVDEFVSQYKADHPGRQYSMRDYDNTISDYDLIMGIDEADVQGADPKAQLRETKQRISRVQSLRTKLADTRSQLAAAEKRIAELTKPGTGKFAQQMRAVKAETALEQEKLNAKGWENVADLSAKQLDRMILEKRSLERQLEKQLQREQDILSGKLKPPAIQSMLKAAREREAERVAQQKDEVFARYKERKEATAIRGRIANLKTELQRRLTNPTDRSYVPAELATSMVDLLDALDTSPREGTQAAAKYQTVSEGLRALAEAYNSLTTDETVGWEYKSEYDEEIRDQIKELAKTMQGRNIRELNLEELQQVYEAVKTIRDSMRQATKLLNTNQFRDIYEAIQSIVDQQKRMTPIADVGWKERNKRRRLLEGLSVMRAVEMMSGWERDAALYSMFQGVEQGQVDADNWIMGYDKAMRPLKTGKNEKAYRDALTKQMDFGATDKESGKTVKMTKLQAIQLYMTWQREQANDKLVHLQKGGATIRDAIAIQNGKGSKAASHTVRVTPELIANIENSLTEWDRAYMKEIRGYLDKEAKAVNRVLYALKHRVLATEAAYMPYVVDNGYLETKLEGSDVFNLFVKTPGSTQALQKKAPQPVIIDGLDNMMARHVRDQAQYIGLALPIRDFAKVFNGRLSSEDGDVYTSLKKTIEDNFEAGGTHLLVQALLDIQNSGVGEAWQSQIAAALNRLHSSFVKAALLINPSVTIKQAASYIAAESVLSHTALERGNHPIWTSTDKSKAFMPGGLIAHLFNIPEGRTAQRLYDEIDAHTSMHYIRRQGLSHSELANEAQRDGRIKRAVNAVGARMEQNKAGHVARKAGEMLNPTKWIMRMDVATTAALWVACKEQAKLDGMKAGTTEYWNRVTELYERCLRETQPMYDGLHRTAHQKQGGGLMQYLFPFRTVPIQNHGQIVSAYEAMRAMKGQSKEKQVAAKKFFAKTVWAQTQSAVVFSLMTFLAAALKRKTKKYRDEDEEFTLESFLEGLGGDTASTLFSVAFPMWGSEAWSIGSRALNKIDGTSGYSYDAFTVGAVDMLNELATAGDKVLADAGKMIRGEDVSGSDVWSHVLGMLTKGAKIAGIPADTVKTYYAGIKANVQDAIEGRIPALNDASWERSNATNARRLIKALEAGDEAKAKAVMEEMRQNILKEKPNLKADKVNAKIQSAVQSYVKQQYLDDEMSEEKAIHYMVEYGSADDENDAFWKIREWEAREAWDGEADDFSFSKYTTLREIIDNVGDISEEMQYLQDHGVKFEDANKEIKSYIGKQLKAGEYDEDEAMKTLQAYHKVKDEKTKQYRPDTDDEAWLAVKEWKANAEHADDEDYSWNKYEDLFAAMDKGGDIEPHADELESHGIKESDIKDAVVAHVKERYEAGEVNASEAMRLLQKYRGMDANEAYWKVDEWDAKEAAYNAGEEFTDSNYRDLYAAIDANKDASAAIRELTEHGYKKSAVTEATKKYLKKQLEEGTINETQFRNKIAHYLGITKTEDGDVLVKEVSNAKRYKEMQKKYPNLDFTSDEATRYCDGTTTSRKNGHKSAQQIGMSLEAYLKARAVLKDVKGYDNNGDGKSDQYSREKMFIQALNGMNLTAAQKWALYYEEYEGKNWRYVSRPSW